MIPTGAIESSLLIAGLFFCACIIDAQKDKRIKASSFLIIVQLFYKQLKKHLQAIIQMMIIPPILPFIISILCKGFQILISLIHPELRDNS